jgi:threonine synthase
MDIQVSSNFERLLFDAYDRDAGAVRGLMNSLTQSRRFSIAAPALARIRDGFIAGRGSEDETAATIRAMRRETGYVADPHTAVALAVAEKEPRDAATPMVVLSTAHPAKFPDAVEAACGVRPGLPDWLSSLNAAQENMTVLPADQAAVEKFVTGAARAAREGAAA